MSTGDEAELRDLQAKAYGRAGGLTTEEAARLQELQRSRLGSADGAPSRPASTGQDPAVETSGETEERSTLPDAGAAPAAEAEGEEASGRGDATGDETPIEARTAPRPRLARAFRERWVQGVAAATALLLVGGVVGWAVSGIAADQVRLTSAQQTRLAEIETQGFDDGTVRIIGEDEDALVWYGTKQEGEMECVILDVAETSSTQCARAEDLSAGFQGGAVVVDSSDPDNPTQVSAQAVRAASGEVVAVIQRWEAAPDDAWLAGFDKAERDRVMQLVDEGGFERYSISVVGYAGGEPVWSGVRSDETGTEQCLVVDAIGARHCVPSDEAQFPGEGISIEGVSLDEQTGAQRGWSIQLAFTRMGTAYLTITGDIPQGAQVDSGEFLVLGSEHGDPITVEVPSTDPEP